MALPVHGGNGTVVLSGTTSVAVPVPASLALNNLVLVGMAVESGSQAVTPAANFFEAPSSPVVVGTHTLRIYWKRQTSATGAGETTGTYAFTVAAGVTQTGAEATRFTGVVTSGNPFDVTNSAIKTTTSDGTCPQVGQYTTGIERLWVWYGGNTSGGSTSAPSTFTLVMDEGNNGLGSATKSQTAKGSSGAVTGSFGTAGVTSGWIGALMPTGGFRAPYPNIHNPINASSYRANLY